MNSKAMTKDAIRVYLCNALRGEYNCVLGSSHIDKSYEEFNNSICFDVDNLIVHIKVETSMVGVPLKEHYIAVIWWYHKGSCDRSYVHDLVIIHVAEPNFGDLYADIRRLVKELRREIKIKNATPFND
jgi:hypothetical protein